jgi:antitoxin (DNA-binding transcriptional repressor) of toxin-antitoxin stability system
MRVTVSDAKGQLTELVRRAEAGEEVVITRHGQPVVRLVREGAKVRKDRAYRARVLEEIMAEGAAKATPGPSAERSQDFLYDEYGVPK